MPIQFNVDMAYLIMISNIPKQKVWKVIVEKEEMRLEKSKKKVKKETKVEKKSLH